MLENIPAHLQSFSKKYAKRRGTKKLLEKIDSIQGGYMLTINMLDSLRLPRKFAFICRDLSLNDAVVFAKSKGIENITGATKEKRYLRLKNIKWWKRQLKVLYHRASETLAGILGVISEHITSATHKNQKNKKKNSYQMMDRTFIIKEGKDPMPLSVIAHQSVIARFSRYLNNIDGMTDYADALRHDCMMITITCPSKMHPNSYDRYDGTSTREAQKHLSGIWANARRIIQRNGIYLYGLRVVEPHKDSTPHWHLMVFGEFNHLDYAGDVITRLSLAIDGKEEGALERRCVVAHINREQSKPSSYLFKYLLKNLGLNKDASKEEAMIEFSENLPSSRAWSQIHGIRQIQMIGGASVVIWDILRKKKTKIESSPELEELRIAAHDGDYAIFFALQGGHKIGKSLHTAKTIREAEKTNGYGEDVSTVKGVQAYGQRMLSKAENVQITSNSLDIQKAIKQNKLLKKAIDSGIASNQDVRGGKTASEGFGSMRKQMQYEI